MRIRRHRPGEGEARRGWGPEFFRAGRGGARRPGDRAVTLIGAYHLARTPLAQRRLVVVLEGTPALADVRAGRLRARGIAHVEGIADGAPLEAEIAWVRRGIDYRLAFRADDGRGLTLVFRQSFEPLTVRRVTELSGALVSVSGVLGRARLRWDWRSALALRFGRA